MKECVKLARQAALLSVVFLVCHVFVKWTGWPVPANVLGIVVLFTLLATGVVREDQIQLAVDFLLRHLVFFFVPIAVGLMSWGKVFYDYGLVLLAAILISTLLPLLGVGFLSRILRREVAGHSPAGDAGGGSPSAEREDREGGR